MFKILMLMVGQVVLRSQAVFGLWLLNLDHWVIVNNHLVGQKEAVRPGWRLSLAKL